MFVHAIPDYINAKEYGAGNWKAVEANRLLCGSLGIPVETVAFSAVAPESLLSSLTPDTRHLMIEYSLWPDLQATVKQQYPHLNVHVRTHNAEAYHYLHRNVRRRLDYVRPRLWRKFGELLVRDSASRRHADSLLGISAWDDDHYWRWLPGTAPIEYMPYFSPWPMLRRQVQPRAWEQRKPTVVSMGGNFDPSGLMNVDNFNALADRLSAVSNERWSFQLTWWSQWHEKVPRVSTRGRDPAAMRRTLGPAVRGTRTSRNDAPRLWIQDHDRRRIGGGLSCDHPPQARRSASKRNRRQLHRLRSRQR